MPYIYCADLWCDSCGIAIIEGMGKVEDTGDSDDYPQYVSDPGPSDSPSHCGAGPECLEAEILADDTKIGCLLLTELTEDGVACTRKAILEGRPVAKFWAQAFDLDWEIDDFTGWEFSFLGIFTGNPTWEDKLDFLPSTFLFQDLVKAWSRFTRKEPVLTEPGESEYSYLAKDSDNPWFQELQDIEISGVFDLETFKWLVEELGMSPTDDQTLGTLGGPANPNGLVPDIVFKIDSEHIIDSIRVTPLPPKGIHPDWNTVRELIIQVFGG